MFCPSSLAADSDWVIEDSKEWTSSILPKLWESLRNNLFKIYFKKLWIVVKILLELELSFQTEPTHSPTPKKKKMKLHGGLNNSIISELILKTAYFKYKETFNTQTGSHSNVCIINLSFQSHNREKLPSIRCQGLLCTE